MRAGRVLTWRVFEARAQACAPALGICQAGWLQIQQCSGCSSCTFWSPLPVPYLSVCEHVHEPLQGLVPVAIWAKWRRQTL